MWERLMPLIIGITQATGRYIIRLDSDDMVLPERVEKQFSFLEENHDIWVVLHIY